MSPASAWLLCFGLFAPALAQQGPASAPDLTTQPTLYVVGYAHLDTEWRWEYPQVIDEYLRKTMEDNFSLIDKYPHYIFNFTGANRYRLMKEYYPADYARMKQYIAEGRWFPAGSSAEEGDVNAPSAESIIRQVLYGNDWFRKEFGKASAEYMLPDCFGFPSSLPTILAHSGVKGFSTQKLVWGSSADGGGPDSLEQTPEGTPFNVGVWVGPDGEKVLAGLNPGAYDGDIDTDLSKPLAPQPPDATLADLRAKIKSLQNNLEDAKEQPSQNDLQQLFALRRQASAWVKMDQSENLDRHQADWAARVQLNGKITGLYTDYHYYGTGDIGGAPREDSVKRLEAIITHGQASLPPENYISVGESHPDWPEVAVGNGPVHVVSAPADQMFLDITARQAAQLPRYTGEMELTNHSAGSLTSQAYQKRWLRREEVLADAAEKASVAASWLGERSYPMDRLNDAWMLVMGGQFHDLAAGTATPKAYEFAWNDDVIAMNQFADVLGSATQAVSSSLDTATDGIPIVVYNALSFSREDVVNAAVSFPEGEPHAVSVTGPDGHEVPAQIANGKVLFLAKVPSVGYAVYSIHAGNGSEAASQLQVSEHSLENAYYRVKIDDGGDISSVFDKTTNKELLVSPMRLAISYDNPEHWPAWNMDWDQEQAAPREYVGGPAEIHVVENGPARIAVEVTRQTAGSKFIQTISLAAGEAGKRVEVANKVDWNTKESNLKAVFPLTASNLMATYNMGIGTIQRPDAEPKKFEVLSHQWIDLTDATGTYGATILTDAKNGSDKPNHNTIRLTLIRTPGVRGGYHDQATQDIGHHEFTYGIAGHAGDWRNGETDAQADQLDTPLMAFQSAKHSGALGREFSLVKINNPRVRVMAVKKAELSDEIVLRLVELDGKPQSNVRISFASPIKSAREINGQEQPLGAATVNDGTLVTSFSAYQPRSFALSLSDASQRGNQVHSEPVTLRYDLAVASNDGTPITGGMDGKGNALPAEMLPETIHFNDAEFKLAAAKTGTRNAIVAKGQTISLPQGNFNKVYVLAAAVDGDQEATFKLGNKEASLKIEDWGGFIGQWDDRQWVAKDIARPARLGRPVETEHDDYAEMTGIKPGYIKPASLAWYCSHHHNASGKNVAYSYSYLFGYSMELPAGAKTITLPRNEKVRILAISVAQEEPAVEAVQPLYDTLGRSEPEVAKLP
jgi:alpha-mannosidase